MFKVFVVFAEQLGEVLEGIKPPFYLKSLFQEVAQSGPFQPHRPERYVVIIKRKEGQ